MARSSSSSPQSSKSYRRRAARLSRMISYYLTYVRAKVGNDIKEAPSAREVKGTLHLMLDTVQVDSKGRAVRDTSMDQAPSTTSAP